MQVLNLTKVYETDTRPDRFYQNYNRLWNLTESEWTKQIC